MSKNALKYKIRSREGDGAIIRLSDLAVELSAISDVLVGLDKLVSKRNVPTMNFRVTRIQYASPPEMTIEANPIKPEVDFTGDVISRFSSGMVDIQNGIIPNDFDRPLVNGFRRIGGSINGATERLEFATDDQQIEIGSQLDKIIDDILGGDESVMGDMSGMLEQINVHGGKNEFRIYPVSGPNYLKCKFSKDIWGKATSAVGKHVTITGHMIYRPRDRFPYYADIVDLEIHPPDSELPSFDDLRGIAPNATRGVSSEEFIRGIRGGD